MGGGDAELLSDAIRDLCGHASTHGGFKRFAALQEDFDELEFGERDAGSVEGRQRAGDRRFRARFGEGRTPSRSFS